MTKHIATLILFLGFAFTQPLLAQQITAFNAESAAFVKELDKLLSSTKRSDCQETADAFTELYKAGSISEGVLMEAIKSGNIMLQARMRPYPQFNAYTRAIVAMVKADQADAKIATWSDILNKVIEAQRRGDTKPFMSYMEFSEGLFNANIIYMSRSKNWMAQSDNYQLSYDDGPKATFSQSDLITYHARDTITIYATSGEYYPLDHLWKGKGGKVDWTRAGLDASQVYADLGSYQIDLENPQFSIDSVTFYNKEYFDFSLNGTYTDKLVMQQGDASYPRFESYRKDLKIKDITPNVTFMGGFALLGDDVNGTGDKYNRAVLEFFNSEGTKVLRARSRNFLLKKSENLSSQDAEVTLYMGEEDSIYHPGLTMTFKIDLGELALYRGSEGVAATPFFDSYHQHEIKTDAIVWKINEPFVNIKMMSGAGQAPATFTSANYFRKGELEKYQGYMDFNPISDVYVYATRNNTREIWAPDLAKKMNPNYTENTIKNLLYKMVEGGFIFYDEEISTITVLDKVFNYIAANGEKIDYDVIKIQSYSPKLNGKIYFKNQDIDLVGVDRVLLSDSQNVFIFPDTSKLQLKSDQDMAFSGKVFAGRLDFTGEGFHFDYDTFKIDLTNLASATIYVPSENKDQYGNQMLVPMRSKIEGLTGYLEIDEPNNKSGKKNYPIYPVFTNLKESFVYYEDSVRIHKGAYKKDSFYFKLKPFVFDSLDTFDPYLSDFIGSFISAGIFPEFEENLKIQKDLSLGFVRTTPDAGYPIYGGKGQFNDTINLSNKGLRGSGTVEYLFNTIQSNDILFFPDSMDAFAQSFEMEKTTYEGVAYPPVFGSDNEIHWLPYEDSMNIDMTNTPFIMYEDSATLTGDLLFTRKGLKGNGAFEFREASLSSNLFNFGSHDLDADTLSLEIKTFDEDKVTFNTPNVKGRVDFDERIGEFSANEENIETTFENNLFKTSINQFFWDMDANYLDFKAPPGSKGVYFVSTKEGQGEDSLKFLSKRAFFNMSTSIIKVDSVPEILVADARIIPDSNKVTILPGGELDTLKRSIVKFDTASALHKIYDATVVIESSKKYKGEGLYDYVVEGVQAHPIIMNDIGVEEKEDRRDIFHSSYANGTIEPEEYFLLHPMVQYHGLVNAISEREHLEFNGYGLLMLENKTIPTQYFAMNDVIDPDTVVIHYDKAVSDKKDSLFTGIYFDFYDTVSSVYSSIMNPLNSMKDKRLFDTKGIIYYDKEESTFRFGNEKKIFEGALTGNVLNYNHEDNIITAEGRFNLGLDLEPVKIATAGVIENIIDSNKYTFNTFLGLDIPIEKDLIQFMSADLLTLSFDGDDIDYTDESFQKALAELTDPRKVDKVLEELNKTGQLTRTKELFHNLVFGDVELLYDPEYQTYRSIGPIGLSFIGDQAIHKEIKGYIEFGIRKNKDFVNIYLEPSEENWYFFSYEDEVLQVLSSNKEFNGFLAEIVPNDRKSDMANEAFYMYTVSTYRKMQEFLYRMRLIYEGIPIEEETLTEEEIFQRELDLIKKELLLAEQDTLPQPGKTIFSEPIEDIEFAEDTTAPVKKPAAIQQWEEEQSKKDKSKKKDKDEKEEEPAPVFIPEQREDGVSDFEMMTGESSKKKKKNKKDKRDNEEVTEEKVEEKTEEPEPKKPAAIEQWEEEQSKKKKSKKNDKPDEVEQEKEIAPEPVPESKDKKDKDEEADEKPAKEEKVKEEENQDDFDMLKGEDDGKKKKRNKKNKDEEEQED